MKQTLLSFLMVLLPLAASADAVEIDGIFYNLISKGNLAEVTQNPNKYSGSVVIPPKIMHEKVEYTVTAIGTGAFWQCTNLTSLTIPNTIVSIAAYFGDCKSLSSVYITDLTAWCNIELSSTSALVGVQHLYINGLEVKDLIIPEGVKKIKKSAFGGYKGLTSVVIPSSVTSIEDYAFELCSNLSNVTMPNTVTSIGISAFAWCDNLTTMNIPNSVTKIGREAFRSCGLKSLTIGNGVKTIDYGAFRYCSSLTSVIIPNSVNYIGENVFLIVSKRV